MQFTQIEFIFFLIVVLGFLVAVRSAVFRKIFILTASYYFYAYWDYRFLSLLLITTFTDYFLGRLLQQSRSSAAKKVLLITSIFINLGILGFFKYFGFFVSSLRELLHPLGINLKSLNIILPIGISFYTFQTLSYTIDVYRGKLKACESLIDFAVFVGFFPQLVAGPIVRASHFLPQLQTNQNLRFQNVTIGLRSFIIGLFKKVFIADRLALFVDPVFANCGVFDSATIWLAVMGFSLQIYFDFSGYSDMAIGCAKMMGFDLPSNFNFPYISKNIREFWRRWHISLSSWIRDYIYIPLGGNRGTGFRPHLNILISMVLCGFWHGASWKFVFWGAFHGVALMGRQIFVTYFSSKKIFQQNLSNFNLLSWLLTTLVVLIGWVIFRSDGLASSAVIIGKMFYPVSGVAWYHPFAIFIIAATILIHVLKHYEMSLIYCLPLTRWYTPAMLFSMLWLVIIFYPREFNPFIYFQF
jgi:alginate O-acetyltransferase complex protein AlgI